MVVTADPGDRLRSGSIAVRNVSKSYGAVKVLREVSVSVEPGRFVTLLGPSGCGKTTLLRLIAGFMEPDAGQILLDGRDVAGLPTQKRPVGMVFQNLALFPHMSVAENVSYGLSLRRLPAAEIRAKLDRFLALVGLSGFDERRISQLSGGQKQRVALARALILEPSIVLLDEPLSALDMQLRKQLQGALKEIQKALGTTFVFVTHDQEEATSMSDQIVVMSEGAVQQIGSPREIYAAPDNLFVARFIGEINEIPGTLVELSETSVLIDSPLGRLDLPRAALRGAGHRPGGAIVLCMRPERLRPVSEAEPPRPEELRLAAQIVESVDLGPLRRLVLEAGGVRLRALSMTGGAAAVAPAGSALELAVERGAVQIFPAAQG